MATKSAQRTFVSLLFVIVLLGAADAWIAERLPFAEVEIKELDKLQEKQLDLFVVQSNLLTTLTTGILAALGAIVLNASGSTPVSRAPWTLWASALLAGFSLYFGYLAYQEVIWMLHYHYFNLDAAPIAWPRRVQFFTFLGSVCCGLYYLLARTDGTSAASTRTYRAE